MYKVNPFPRKLLITSDEVIAMGPTNNDPDPRIIQQAIQIAEDRFIRGAICRELYDDFRNKKNVVVDSVNRTLLQGEFPTGVTLVEGEIVNAIELVDNQAYVTLWNEHLWKLVAECVIYIATPTNWTKFSSAGQMMKNPKSLAVMTDGGGDASASLKDVQWTMDKLLMDRIDPLIAATQEFLHLNAGNYPLYNCRKKSSADNGVSMDRKTGWIHGLYNDNRRGSCCD